MSRTLQGKSAASIKNKKMQSQSSQSTSFLEFLGELADSEQQILNPLPIHSTSKMDEHFRNHYALLLVALLATQKKVSESQSRLLALFLDSMELGDIRAALFEEIINLDKPTILEAIRLVRDAGYESEFMVDAMVLLRIESTLTTETVQALSEFASLLNIKADRVRQLAEDAAQVLGLSEKPSRRRMSSWPRSRVA